MEREPIYRLLGKAIRAKRRANDWHQEKLAGMLGISRATLASIETGRQRLLVHQLYDIARVFGVSPSELLPRDPTSAVVTTSLPFPGGLTPEQERQVASVLDRTRRIAQPVKADNDKTNPAVDRGPRASSSR